MNLTFDDEVRANIYEPYRLLLNVMRNQFNITSDIIVLMSNYFYKDNYSMSFWLGDIFYQVIVI